LPVLQVPSHVHPADALLARLFVGVADDEIHVCRLADPMVEVAAVLRIEYYTDFLSAGPAVVVLELDFAVSTL
jgi:hypothetical protein